ncbi:hypothetical protein ACIBAG_13930 [Streptomyces sp. NPDC051243]|uniref:hypothetical protein n=1 Tax=Streptomyces sp. NPDC051243 TaxID=3365646 RepID=UPI0037BD4788
MGHGEALGFGEGVPVLAYAGDRLVGGLPLYEVEREHLRVSQVGISSPDGPVNLGLPARPRAP